MSRLPTINFNKTQRGYTLLFSVLTATLVLGVAVFILSVSKKQYALSVAARDSIYSIYAADGALECAIAGLGGIASTSDANTIPCNGNTPPATMPRFITSGYTYQTPAIFTGGSDVRQGVASVRLGGEMCAKVIITMGRLSSTYNSIPATVVDSRGYNYCLNADPDFANPRIVERALRFTSLGEWR